MSIPTTNFIYKLSAKPQWEGLEKTAVNGEDRHSADATHFFGAPVDFRDGFIHASTKPQVVRTAALYFKGVEDVLLVEISLESLKEHLGGPDAFATLFRYDFAESRQDYFPHLYCPLPKAAATRITALASDSEGIPIIPADLLRD